MQRARSFHPDRYLAASVLFILGLKGLTRARQGPPRHAAGRHRHAAWPWSARCWIIQIITFTWIILGLIVGSGIGAAISIWMPMTAIPQRTAISHAFGALAATLVGIAHYHYLTRRCWPEPVRRSVEMAALGFEVMFGSLTITGSFMAFGKLQGFVPSAPITYKFQNQSNIGLFVVAVLLFIALVVVPTSIGRFIRVLFYLMVAGRPGRGRADRDCRSAGPTCRS